MYVTAGTDADRISDRLRLDYRQHNKILSSALSSLAFQARLDSQESMRKELDRPRKYSQNAVIYEKATETKMVSSVLVNPNNDYLHRMVYGGFRFPKNKRIVIPSKTLRTDASGNMSRTRRRNMLRSSKTFKVRSRSNKEVLLRRIGSRVEFVALLSKRTRYNAGNYYWKFYESAERSYDRHFQRLFIKAHRRYISSK